MFSLQLVILPSLPLNTQPLENVEKQRVLAHCHGM